MLVEEYIKSGHTSTKYFFEIQASKVAESHVTSLARNMARD